MIIFLFSSFMALLRRILHSYFERKIIKINILDKTGAFKFKLQQLNIDS